MKYLRTTATALALAATAAMHFVVEKELFGTESLGRNSSSSNNNNNYIARRRPWYCVPWTPLTSYARENNLTEFF